MTTLPSLPRLPRVPSAHRMSHLSLAALNDAFGGASPAQSPGTRRPGHGRTLSEDTNKVGLRRRGERKGAGTATATMTMPMPPVTQTSKLSRPTTPLLSPEITPTTPPPKPLPRVVPAPAPAPADPFPTPPVAPPPPIRRRSTHAPPDAPFPSWDWPHLPTLFALAPILSSVLFGRADLLADALGLYLLYFYLRLLTRTPWEMYTSSLSLPLTHPYARTHQLSLLALTLLAPLLGGVLLSFLSSRWTFLPPLPGFSIRLFVLAASVRPVRHVLQIWRDEVGVLDTLAAEEKEERAEVESLRAEMELLKREMATQARSLDTLVRTVKRQERKAELLRLSATAPVSAPRVQQISYMNGNGNGAVKETDMLLSSVEVRAEAQAKGLLRMVIGLLRWCVAVALSPLGWVLGWK